MKANWKKFERLREIYLLVARLGRDSRVPHWHIADGPLSIQCVYFSNHLIEAFFFSIALRQIWDFFLLVHCEIFRNLLKFCKANGWKLVKII